MPELEKLIWLLPGEVLGSIVTGNLNLQDISRLDVACFSHKVRQLYIDALGSHGRLEEVTINSNVLCWITKRSLKIGTVNVEPLNDYGVLASVIQQLICSKRCMYGSALITLRNYIMHFYFSVRLNTRFPAFLLARCRQMTAFFENRYFVVW
jgi:hypothetical protein